jgi:hypothetical protein
MTKLAYNILLIFITLSLTSCKEGQLVSSSTPQVLNPSNPDSNPTGTPTATPTSTPTATPTSGTGGVDCSTQSTVYCEGGFGGAAVKKSIPTKVIFLNPAGGTLSNDPTATANSLINTANAILLYNNHQFMKFDLPTIEQSTSPGLTAVMNSSYMISTYGSTQHYVLVLVKGMVAGTGGIIGYSPGLRNSVKNKDSIVVMDYDFVVGNSMGKNVIIHELFHGLGAPHTTDGNGGQDNVFMSGVQDYQFLKDRSGNLALNINTMKYSFPIYVEEELSYQGVRFSGGRNWDTRTLMMWFATSNPLFVSGDSGFNMSYSHILDVYYDSFVK